MTDCFNGSSLNDRGSNREEERKDQNGGKFLEYNVREKEKEPPRQDKVLEN